MITEEFVLPVDVVLTPVRELPESLREQLDADDESYALSRPTSRAAVRILDSQAADLVHRFRSPTRIIDAVLAYSREHRSPPEATLDEAFPMLQQLIESKLLVAADSDQAARGGPSLRVGESFAGGQVLATVQALHDTELHLVMNPDGSHAALKLFKTAGQPDLLSTMHREAAILRRLDGLVSPRLLAVDEQGALPYLLLEWRPGVSPLMAAADTVHLSVEERRRALRELCAAVADAYARLHSAGVVHSDVHPGNLLVARDGSVTILDFGLAIVPGSSDPLLARAPRGGIPFFFEPEYASARRLQRPLPAASFLGEQFAVAAILYLLVTGNHYVNLSLEAEEMFRQITEDSALPFEARAVAPWPALETLIATCLEKSPERRLTDMATVVQRLKTVDIAAPAVTFNGGGVDLAPARALLGDVLRRVGFAGPLLSDGLPVPPTSSVNFGAAGIAYALYRLACHRDDPGLLALADVWATRAQVHMDEPDACYSDQLDVTPQTVGRSSIFHATAGIEAVAALIAHARGDSTARQVALAGFLERSQRPARGLDLTLGRSSTVLGCCLLLDALVAADPAEHTALQQCGEKALEGIWKEITAYQPIADGGEIEYLGVAHGWAGVLYATLRWTQVTGHPPPSGVATRLDELAQCGEPWGRGLRWKILTRGGNDYMSGWCNGSAGFVHLFTMAQRITGDDRWTTLAERAAWSTWEGDGPTSTLCCGRGGRAYALLNLYRHTGQDAWLERARALASRAAAETAEGESEGRGDSLYKGRLGVALLAAEIETPERAAMPFFETEGWTRGGCSG